MKLKYIILLTLFSTLGGSITYFLTDYFKKSEEIIQPIVDSNRDENEKPKFVYTKNNPNNIYELDFTSAAQKTVNAVVHIKSEYEQAYHSDPLLDYFWGPKGSRGLRPATATGSGVIISEDGYVVTNNHVINDALNIIITLNDGRALEAELVGSDPNTDLALLKIDEKNLPFTEFGNSDDVDLGDWVLAVGNPFNLNSTVTAGIISAKSRDLNKRDGVNESYIQTDAAVNRGNSGGALVNTSGELIGINTAITSVSGGFVGYSFAVPSNVARKVFEDLIEYGDVQRGLLGVMGQALDAQFAERFEVEETEGFYITDLEEGLGADLAGLKPGDIIKSVDGITINKFADLSGYLSTKRPGEKVKLIYKRDGNEMRVDVRLEKINRTIFFYMEVRELTKDQKEDYNTEDGLYISNMNNRRLYQNGIDSGYIILEINGQRVSKLSDVKGYKMGDIESILFLNPAGEKEKIILKY